MGKVIMKAQLVTALEAVVKDINALYSKLDELNGSMHELLEETDVEQSMELAGVTDTDVESDFGWIREFYQRQLPTAHDLDMVKDTLYDYKNKLEG